VVYIWTAKLVYNAAGLSNSIVY